MSSVPKKSKIHTMCRDGSWFILKKLKCGNFAWVNINHGNGPLDYLSSTTNIFSDKQLALDFYANSSRV
jgi:hypothetical protein